MPEISLDRTMAVLQRGIDGGLHTGGQVSVITADGREAHAAVGTNHGQAMTRDLLMPWMCAARPVLALALCGLMEGTTGWLDHKMADYLPDYAQGGKGEISIRQVLTHTTGVSADPVAAIFRLSWQEALRRICGTSIDPELIAGSAAAYQHGTYWYLVGELIARVSGKPVSEYLNDVLRTLGLTQTWIGMSDREFNDNEGRLSLVQRHINGAYEEVPAREQLFCCAPGPLSPRGPVRDLARFYSLLLSGEVAGIVSPQTLTTATAPARVGQLDIAYPGGSKIVDCNLLGMLESRRYGRKSQIFGRMTSDASFGHTGVLGVVGFCDPEHKVAAAFALDANPGSTPNYLRTQNMCTSIMEDVSGGPIKTGVAKGAEGRV
jgi:CubicO group peptidase (beta-lactamase class C family)